MDTTTDLQAPASPRHYGVWLAIVLALAPFLWIFGLTVVKVANDGGLCEKLSGLWVLGLLYTSGFAWLLLLPCIVLLKRRIRRQDGEASDLQSLLITLCIGGSVVPLLLTLAVGTMVPTTGCR